MLKRLIAQIREQIHIGRMKRRMRQAELKRIRDRHHRRHKDTFSNTFLKS
ncbi:hypothetical protein [Leptolyngbya sp. CCY15150]|nr:hypothetical protein [Leptolyngbya sp. CCY15150]